VEQDTHLVCGTGHTLVCGTLGLWKTTHACLWNVWFVENDTRLLVERLFVEQDTRLFEEGLFVKQDTRLCPRKTNLGFRVFV